MIVVYICEYIMAIKLPGKKLRMTGYCTISEIMNVSNEQIVNYHITNWKKPMDVSW
ncbi:MAG: hypothetical protein HDT39_16510 [Lachnospiraceae bacterium]|nr:hypothetical protein [Lachnospiraceae bacterium]